MEIRENDRICIYAPLNSNLGAYDSERLLKEISKDDRDVAIDLQYVENCTVDFIETIKCISCSKKIGIFNISSDIFTILNVIAAACYVYFAIDVYAKKAELKNVAELSLGDGLVERYLHGETLNMDIPNGYCAVCVDGFPIGLGKAVGGVIKNHLPKGLRI